MLGDALGDAAGGTSIRSAGAEGVAGRSCANTLPAKTNDEAASVETNLIICIPPKTRDCHILWRLLGELQWRLICSVYDGGRDNGSFACALRTKKFPIVETAALLKDCGIDRRLAASVK